MTRNELIDQYFDWMYQLVVDNRYSKSYRKLFARLPKTASTLDIGSVASIPIRTL